MKGIKIVAWLVAFGVALGSPIVGLMMLPERAIAQVQDSEIDRAMKKLEKGRQLFREGNKSSLIQAIQELETALQSSLVKDNKSLQSSVLFLIGRIYDDLGEKQKALDYYDQALKIGFEKENKFIEVAIRNNIGQVYVFLGEIQKALNFYNQALLIVQQNDSQSDDHRLAKALLLNNIGQSYYRSGETQKALDFYNQALSAQGTIKSPSPLSYPSGSAKATILNNIATVHNMTGEKQKAIDFLDQALSIFRSLNIRSREASILNALGSIYDSLGQHQKALQYYYQALSIRHDVGDYAGKGVTLHNIGATYDQLGEKHKALEYYTQALSIYQSVGDRQGEATTLSFIASVLNSLHDSQKALEYYTQALSLSRNIGHRTSESRTLNGIGLLYQELGENQKALNYYHQALPITQFMGNHSGEAMILNNIGSLLNSLQQYEGSIISYKQSVATYEKLRGFIQKLPTEQQATYTQSIAPTYRALANLLLKQNRVMEAIQVLDLLKAQELRQYLPDRSPNSAPTSGTEDLLLPQERTFWNRYKAIMQPAIDQSTEFNDLTRLTQPTPQQTQRLNELKRIQDQIPEQLNQYRNSPEANTLFNQIKNTAAQQNLDLPIYKTFQIKINTLSQNAALFYPLLLDDRLELVILIPGKPPIRRTVNVTKAELENHIKTFRQQIGDAYPNGIPKHDINTVKQSAQQLYNWLIQPIAAELQAANIQTILYAPDGQLRYIPLAALYDGKEWLTQKYQINHLTALALTPIEPASSQPPRTLAAAFTQGTYSYKIPVTTPEPQPSGSPRSGNPSQSIDFTGLRHGRGEIESLSQILQVKPDTLFDQDFSKAAIESRLPNYNILHLATHGIFIPDKPEESFIVMGNGEKLRLTDIKDWNFPNLQFVMLSACETGQGDQLSNGIEVLGFGYQLQQAKVRASMTSLWKVHDAGTRLLSQHFYKQVYSNNLRKTAALQKVQQDFISGKMDVEMAKLRGACFGHNCDDLSMLPAPTTTDATHPYYWAPFIIVGNGL